MEYATFERELLRLIFSTSVKLGPVSVAYHLGLTVAEARMHLERAVSEGVLEAGVDASGRATYTCPDRPAPSAAQPLALVPTRPARLERALAPEAYLTPPEQPSAATAAALSLLMPGAGHIYCGRVPEGVAWMMATGMGYLLFIIPGLILHVCCLVNAAAVPVRLRLRQSG